MNTQPRKLRRVVLKEEFVILTGDPKKAILLNQLLYWSERIRDFDKFIDEEKRRYQVAGTQINMPLSNGWIYKSAKAFSEELMGIASEDSISRYLKEFLDKGYISERANPVKGWDRTKQYRVNVANIQAALISLGLSLSDYPLELIDVYEDPEEPVNAPIPQNAECNPHFAESNPHSTESIPQPAESIPHGAESISAKTGSNTRDYSKTTSETTSVSRSVGSQGPKHGQTDLTDLRPTLQELTEFKNIKNSVDLDEWLGARDKEMHEWGLMWERVLEYMYFDPAFALSKGLPQSLVRKRMNVLDAGSLTGTYRRVSEHIRDTGTQITNKLAYLATALLNDPGKNIADSMLDPDFQLTTIGRRRSC